MGMHVDKPRHDQSTGGHEDLLGGIRSQVRFDSCDARVVDGDVAPPAQALTRIQDIAALDQEVVLLPGCWLERADGHRCRRLSRRRT
jgi:hypothetical protein